MRISDWSADVCSSDLEDYDETGRLRGASTITMQVARNLFLWPGGGFVRKALEAPLALLLDALWPKRRILEVYLNVAEMGRSEERRGRKVCGSTCRSRWSPYP